MAGGLDIPTLHVEGKDDLYVIAELLQRHAIDMAEGKRPFQIIDANGNDKLLAEIPTAVKAASSRPVGFVLDIDVPMVDRWKQVREKFREARVEAPDQCPPDGFIGRRKGYTTSVGVWLMPDCASDGGKLEDLLKTLVPPVDPVWPHALKSTEEAKRLGAKFSNADDAKANVHCWLAWQEEPGKPFGTAINAKFFNHDSPQALSFLRWLKRLYGLSQLIIA